MESSSKIIEFNENYNIKNIYRIILLVHLIIINYDIQWDFINNPVRL